MNRGKTSHAWFVLVILPSVEREREKKKCDEKLVMHKMYIAFFIGEGGNLVILL